MTKSVWKHIIIREVHIVTLKTIQGLLSLF